MKVRYVEESQEGRAIFYDYITDAEVLFNIEFRFPCISLQCLVFAMMY